MKKIKIIIGVLSILIGIVALIESYDVFRLAYAFGQNGFHIYVGFIVGLVFIGLGILSMVMTDEENNKKYAETAAALCSIAFFFCFRGPQLFTDLYFFAGWAVICFIFACVVYYKKEKSNEDVDKQPVSHLTSQKECPYCHAVVDGSSTFCGSCGKRIQKICPHCGAAVNNDDMFCKNCGHTFCDDSALSTNTQEIQIRKCNHCGAELNNSDTFCQKCGAKIDDNSTAVSSAESQHIIDFNKDSSNDSNRGNLFIRWEGKWSIIDYKVQIWVNGIKQGDYSFKDGFEVIVPISSPEMVVETKLSFHKTKEVLTLNPQENYSYNLAYNTVSGSFGFILCDNDGNELETDKLHWGYFLLCFLIPIVGFIYALSIKKKKPATSNQALMVSLLGFVVSLILSYSMPVAISRYNEIKAAKIAREKFVKDSLEQVRQDSIKKAEAKMEEEKEAADKEQHIAACKAFLEKFFKGLDDSNDLQEYVKQNTTFKAQQFLKDEYDLEDDCSNCLATWMFTKESGTELGSFRERMIEMIDENTYQVISIYELDNAGQYTAYEYVVKIGIVKEGNFYKIDTIEKISASPIIG